ncbi:MAG: galactokinase [Desulfobacteraceae bacterium]|nr:galactokinase [Desulfobacteraceae bacterium]MCF8094555.1 galactokinase [Desulfobacteraceae bacterium]
MKEPVRQILEQKRIAASSPCRIDMGGTLDISSLFYPLAYLRPCTFNIALNMRTRVSLHAFTPGWIRVNSKGFDPAEYPIEEMPFDHPLGLMFAVAAYFGIDGISIEIESASPPRSALGGSSSAAVALVAAYIKLFEKAGFEGPDPYAISVLAHELEQSIAGVPCGMQDQLAALFGGVNAWHWRVKAGRQSWERQQMFGQEKACGLKDNILVAYCGITHESSDINGTWIRRFLAGQDRNRWAEIVGITKQFVEAFAHGDFDSAARFMNRETEIRRELTPRVVDETGAELIEAALAKNCGARFSGAGGGGCLWALGSAKAVSELFEDWATIVELRPDALMLEIAVDDEGVKSEI